MRSFHNRIGDIVHFCIEQPGPSSRLKRIAIEGFTRVHRKHYNQGRIIFHPARMLQKLVSRRGNLLLDTTIHT